MLCGNLVVDCLGGNPGGHKVRCNPPMKAVWTGAEGFVDIGMECDTKIVSPKR
jgi:hypothetical protein